MNDYFGIGILVLPLTKKWYSYDGFQKSLVIRSIALISVLIALLIFKIIKSINHLN